MYHLDEINVELAATKVFTMDKKLREIRTLIIESGKILNQTPYIWSIHRTLNTTNVISHSTSQIDYEKMKVSNLKGLITKTCVALESKA